MRYADESKSDFVHRILREKGFGVERGSGPRRIRVFCPKTREELSAESKQLRDDMAERDAKRWDEAGRSATVASLEARR